MHAAAITPDKPAIVMAGSGQVVTYRELDEQSNRLAHLFRAAGLHPGDHIAFMLENHPLFLPVAWAAHRSGLYYTPVSSRLQTDELAYIVDNCGARVFISSAKLADVASSITDATPGVEVRLMIDGTAPGFTSYEEAVAGQPSTPIEDECQGMDMLYSSGTTGRPKGILLPFPPEPVPLDTPSLLQQLVETLFDPSPDSVYLSPAPLYHAAPLRYCLTFLQIGATIVVMERFDPEQALALIERYGVTHGQWVPTMFIKMLKLPDEIRKKYDLSSQKFAIHAAAPCPVAVKEQMIDWWGPVIHEYYAGTEANGLLYVGPQEWLQHKGTVGRSPQIRVCDEEGNELPRGERGVVYFADSPQFEYHGDPEKTRASRDPKGRGWTTLGDIGYLDEDDYLFLTDRRAHMIISGGVNIYPQEAEDVLSMHPKVADVAVLGVPDEEMGESVKAVVEPVSMADAGPELEAELIAYCRSRLAHYKCPKSVDFRSELPRHPTGKLYKRLLKAEYWPKTA
ncbi:MAG TPA: acyl-CoA synthetase [Thermopolyspora sp.]|jgi:Acyl-CoA synthetases (AMP-forming)/AMP-acid ligases II